MAKLVQVAVPNHLGDAVMALPAIRRLARGLPESRLRLVGRPLPATVLDGQGPWEAVKSDWLLDRSGAAVLFAPSFRVALAAWRAKLPRRIGTPTDVRGWLLTHRVAGTVGPLHQAAVFRAVADAALEVLGGPEALQRADGVDESSLRAVNSDPAGARWWDAVGRPKWLLHPWAAGSPSKRWPAESWATLGRLLLPEGLAITGGPEGDDARSALELAAELGVACAAGGAALTPSQWASAAVCAEGVILPDTGLAHLADAVGARTAVLFGATDPACYAPPGSTVVRGTSMEAIQPLAVLECLRA